MLTVSLVFGCCAYRSAFLSPLREKEAVLQRDAANLSERIEKAKKTIAEVRAAEEGAAPIRQQLEKLQEDLPVGSTMVALPALVKAHFARAGVAVRLIRLNTTQNQPDIPGFERGFWSVALPIDENGRNVAKLLMAVTDLDRENPFIRILNFAIRPDPENPRERMASLNVTSLIRK
jgi:hypothetical protein